MKLLSDIGEKWSHALAYAAKHERLLGAILFAFGFLTDLLTFGLLPVEIVNWFFISYLALAALAVLGTHWIFVYRARDAWWRKSLAVIFPLIAQYAFGGLFSGFVVFYARSSVFSVSWPFLLLLVLMYVGNEYFRKQREHLIFQAILFFFALYAYAIFALPLYLGTIGPWTFLGSTLAAVLVAAGFLYLLSLIHAERLMKSGRVVGSAIAGIVAVVCLSYFGGLIPPLPLALVEEGVFHSVIRTGSGYTVTREADGPWWDIGVETVSVAPGTALSVYSAVRAPIAFSSSIVHRWERYNGKEWVTEGKISFPMNGGRTEGYRGYTTKTGLAEGKWRVSVETASGQTIGRIRFDAQSVPVPPSLITETR